MKKIINNRVYDTDKARELGSCSRGLPGELEYVSETLYQKRTGEYFIRGEGGAATRYAEARSTGDGWTGGERIFPLSADKARDWAEAHLSAEDYEAQFGIPDDDDGGELEHLHIQIPAAMLTRIRQRASAESKSLTACITELLASAL